MTLFVSYDIPDDKVRSQLSRFLEENGIRIQKSVFAVEIDRNSFSKFLKCIKSITKGEGKVAVLRLCETCVKNAIKLGNESRDCLVF